MGREHVVVVVLVPREANGRRGSDTTVVVGVATNEITCISVAVRVRGLRVLQLMVVVVLVVVMVPLVEIQRAAATGAAVTTPIVDVAVVPAWSAAVARRCVTWWRRGGHLGVPSIISTAV